MIFFFGEKGDNKLINYVVCVCVCLNWDGIFKLIKTDTPNLRLFEIYYMCNEHIPFFLVRIEI